VTVIDLAKKRQPVTYTLVITHHWDGTFEFTVLDVADDERSQESVGYALKKAAEAWGNIRERGAPQREWQGLTYKERNDCLVEADPCEALLDHEAHELMRTVEAKLQEKNT